MMPLDSQGLIQLAAILGEGYGLGFLGVVTRSLRGREAAGSDPCHCRPKQGLQGCLVGRDEVNSHFPSGYVKTNPN